jgi:lysylphosphatidylglycerol synthetase-like protein (DUF2156 family)
MISGTGRQLRAWGTALSRSSYHLGIALLVIAGVFVAASADYSKDWDFGSRWRPGRDNFKYLALLIGLHWLLLVPGIWLTLMRSVWWRIVAVIAGCVVWLTISELFSPIPASSWLKRGYWLALSLVVVCCLPFLGDRRDVVRNRGRCHGEN